MASNILTKQVGPLPVGAWGVVIVGALGMAYIFNKGQSSGDSGEVLLAEPGVGTGGGQFIYDEPTTVTPNIAEETTNIQWQTRAWAILVSKGMNPSQVGTALSKYLNGESLTAVEQGIVDQAILAAGVPPESFTPAPPPTSPTPSGQWTITLVTQTPQAKKGQRMRFNGTVLYNGEPKGGKVVLVQYRNAGSNTWLTYPGGRIKTFSNGNWTFAPKAYKSRYWRFTVEGTNASVTSRLSKVTK